MPDNGLPEGDRAGTAGVSNPQNLPASPGMPV